MDNLDSQAIKKALNLKNSTVVFQRWVLQDSKSKIYVISTNRIHLLAKKPPHKVELSVHLLDLQGFESSSSQSVKISVGGEKPNKLVLQFTDDEDAILSISHVLALFWLNFPAFDVTKLINVSVTPEERTSTLVSFNEAFKASQADVGPCNGFSTTYFSICNYYGQPSLAEVAWDIDKIYACHTCTEFNVADFDHLENKELFPLIATLGFNDWFKSFRCVSLKLSSDVTDAMYKMLKMSRSLESIILKNLHFSKESVQKMTTALASNQNVKIKSIDLTENSIEDRGLVHLCGLMSSLPHGVETVVLKDVGISSKGSGTLSSFFRSAKNISSSLVRLSLAENPLKSDGTAAVGEFLSRPNALKELDLSNTDCAIDLIFGALLRGCLQNLETLNMSGNPFSYKRKNAGQVLPSLQQFFSSAIAIRTVDLSSTKLPPEAAKAILLGLIGNNATTCVSLNFSKNELRGTGANEIGNCLPGLKNLTSLDVSENGFDLEMISFCENAAKNTSLRRLNLAQNIGKIKSSNVANVVESLVEMCLADTLPLEYLSVADNKLKQDTSNLFDSLGANNSLQELDISGNAMGDEGARLLAKALQLNTRLRIVHLDRNGVTHKGYDEIATALKRNYSMQLIPTPISDMTQGLKHYSEQLQKHLHKIEKLLHRNMSMEKVNRDHFFRLQQNVMLGFLNQQRIDEMVVSLEDTIISAKEVEGEEVVTEVKKSKAVVREAEKLKDVVHSICVDAINIDKTVESKMESMSDDISSYANDLLKKNIIDMLERVREECPAIFANKKEVEQLQFRLIDESKVDISPIKDNVGRALYAVVLQKIKEASMAVASSIAEQLTIIVHDTLNSSVNKLKQSMKVKPKKQEKEASPKKITKNRLSLFADGAEGAPATASNLKRRPTFHRNRKDTFDNAKDVEVSIDIDGEASPKVKPQKISVTGDLSPQMRERIPTVVLDSIKGKEELSSMLKDRAKPAKGRRPPTRVSQLAHFASNEALDDIDSGEIQNEADFSEAGSEPKPELAVDHKPEAATEDAETANQSEVGVKHRNSSPLLKRNQDEREVESEEKKEKEDDRGSPPKPPPTDRKPTPKPRISRHKDDFQVERKRSEGLAPEPIPRSCTAPSRESLAARKTSKDMKSEEEESKPMKKADSFELTKEDSEPEAPSPAEKPERSPRPMPKPRMGMGMPMIPANVMQEMKQRQQQKSAPESPDKADGHDIPKPVARKRTGQRSFESDSDQPTEKTEGQTSESAVLDMEL